jgi:hypothetical protein
MASLAAGHAIHASFSRSKVAVFGHELEGFSL